MATKPIQAIWICPHCNKPLPIVWDGNYVLKCAFCGESSKVKRQKLKVFGEAHRMTDEEIKRYENIEK